ncbi:hypothetical protein BS78_02G119600 [Paspalum vaginatum]|nr:hypothetical protein BS78_02G119600 [Paspalum vaginatum]
MVSLGPLQSRDSFIALLRTYALIACLFPFFNSGETVQGHGGFTCGVWDKSNAWRFISSSTATCFWCRPRVARGHCGSWSPHSIKQSTQLPCLQDVSNIGSQNFFCCLPITL